METISCRGNRGKLLHARAGTFDGDLAGISALTVCVVLGILCIAMGVYELVRYFKLGLAAFRTSI